MKDRNQQPQHSSPKLTRIDPSKRAVNVVPNETETALWKARVNLDARKASLKIERR